MISRRVWSSAIILLTLGIALNVTVAQEPVGTVAQPVSGLYARGSHDAPDTRLGVLNAKDNIWTDLVPAYGDRPFWNSTGEQIVLRQAESWFSFLDYPAPSVSSVTDLNGVSFVYPSQQMSFYPIGWSNDSSDVVYLASYRLAGRPRNYGLYLVDRVGNVLQTIREWSEDQTVIDLPLPPDATTVQLRGGGRFERNPVYNDWLVMQFEATGYYLNNPTAEPVRANINVLWNFRTQQVISLDALVPDLYISYDRVDWSHDGTRLILHAGSKTTRDGHILNFRFTPEIGAMLVERAVVENRTAEHWLDAGDLFFSLVSDYDGGASYVLGEIVDGEYRETPFFTLYGEMFSSESFGDWFMQADEAERNRLSCLFDRALATQLVVGDAAQVVADDGVVLHAASDRFSTELQTMAEGAIMTIINGPACSGGYRWWQVELSDGIVGWAVETDDSEYFLQVP